MQTLIIRVFLVLIIPLQVYSQTDVQRKQHTRNQLLLKITPTSLVDIEPASLPVSVEYCFATTWGIAAGVSLPLHYLLRPFTGNIDDDRKYRFEGRKYFNIGKRSKMLLGLEGYLRKTIFSFNKPGTYDEITGIDVIPNYYTKAKLERKERGAGVEIGIQQQIADRLYIEYNIGIGLREIKGNYYDVEDQVAGSHRTLYQDFGTNSLDLNFSGSETWLYLPFG